MEVVGAPSAGGFVPKGKDVGAMAAINMTIRKD
jgi:hypothetical protein